MPETKVPENIAGRTFGRVTVLEFSHESAPNKRYWRCECKCGKIRVLREDAIKALPTCRQCRSNDIANARLNKARASRFGVSLAQLKAMLVAQDNKCAICRGPFTESLHWCVDHDHSTDKIRGLLCRLCNVALGGFRDSVWNLKAAISYLEAVEPNSFATDPKELPD